jgi:hypothetical protein
VKKEGLKLYRIYNIELATAVTELGFPPPHSPSWGSSSCGGTWLIELPSFAAVRCCASTSMPLQPT